MKRFTTRKWRSLGNALISCGAVVAGTSIVGDHKYIAMLGLGFNLLGQFLINFFKEERRAA